MQLLRIQEIVDDRLCYEKVRELRWCEGVKCPHCQSKERKRHGQHNSTEHRYRYQCKGCQKYFDDLTNTVFQGHHQPLKIWIICLYLMGLNLSNTQIFKELGITENDCHAMTSLLREGFERRGFPPNDEPAGWDGTWRGQPVQPGVYVWLAEIRLTGGSTLRKSGDVTVME